jgi:hypothetical protein
MFGQGWAMADGLVVGVELVVVEGADVAAYAATAPPPSRTPVRVRAPTTFITRGLMVVHLPSDSICVLTTEPGPAQSILRLGW